MKRTARLLLGVLLAGMCLTACDDGGGDGMTQEKWRETVSFDMTQAQVEAAVGRPPDQATTQLNGLVLLSWRYGDDAGTVTMHPNGAIYSIGWATGMYG